ncbi:MAG: hypothetical protein ACJ77K_09280 [Bacteroidia bacterium]
MSNYKFLLKPLFFIFNLLFATWLVLKIEQIQAPDAIMPPASTHNKPGSAGNEKAILRSLLWSYKAGRLDSIQLDNKIDDFLKGLKGN